MHDEMRETRTPTFHTIFVSKIADQTIHKEHKFIMKTKFW